MEISPVSIFLAKTLGLYMAIVGALIALRGEAFLRTLEDILAQPGLIVLTAVISLIVGLAMVVGHSIWELSWRGLITLFGSAVLIKGILLWGYPDAARKLMRWFHSGPQRWALAVGAMALGLWLAWQGFRAG